MADGSVQSFSDKSGDGYLNPGFPITAGGGGVFNDAPAPRPNSLPATCTAGGP